MFDEIFDRSYQSGRADLNNGLDAIFGRVGKATGNIFRVLNRIEFDAPWTDRSRGTRRA